MQFDQNPITEEDNSTAVRLKTFNKSKYASLLEKTSATPTQPNSSDSVNRSGYSRLTDQLPSVNSSQLPSNRFSYFLPHPADSPLMASLWQRTKNSFISGIEYFGPYDPNSNVIFGWGIVSVFFVLYNCLSIPLRIGFEDLWVEDNDMHAVHIFFLVTDYIGDVCFLIDIFLHFRTTYMEGGIVYSDTTRMAKRYWESGFKWDLLASLPINFFSFSISKHALLRINCLIRLRRLMEYFEVWELHSKYSNGVLMLRLLGAILLYLHWLCCFYVGISYEVGIGTSEWTPPAAFVDSTFWSLYLFGLFWAVKMTTGLGGEVPAPGNDLERGFTLVAAFLSLLIAGYIIGNIVNLIGTLNESSEEFRNKMNAINLYMTNKKLPHELTRKVRNYYNHLWNRQGGVDDEVILGALPSRLKTEVSLHINGDIVTKVDLFKGSNPGFINQLVEVLKPEIYTPGDTIIKQGDVGTEMYFISQGVVDVYIEVPGGPDPNAPKTEKKVNSLREGDFFGEIALLLQSTRAATIRAATYCDLYVLRKADLDRVLKMFPGERDTIVRKGMFKLLRDRVRKALPKEPTLFVLNDDRRPDDPPQQVGGMRSAFVKDLIDSYVEVEAVQQTELLTAGDAARRVYFVGGGTVEFFEVDDGDNSTQVVGTYTVSGASNGFFVGFDEYVLRATHRYGCRVVDERAYVAQWDVQLLDPIFQRYAEARDLIAEFVATKPNSFPPASMAKTGSTAAKKDGSESGRESKKAGSGYESGKEGKDGGKEGGAKSKKLKTSDKSESKTELRRSDSEKKKDDKKSVTIVDPEEQAFSARFDNILSTSKDASPEELLLACRLLLNKINREQ